MRSPSAADPVSPPAAPAGHHGWLGRVQVLAAFWLLGVVGAMAAILVSALRAIFALDLSLALIAQWLPLAVGGGLSIPMLAVIRRLGDRGALRLASGAIAAGGAALAAAVANGRLGLVLAALAAISAGLAGLQVAGNPLAASLPPRERRHAHLALAQAFNGLGTWMGVNLGAWLMLGNGPAPAASAQGVAAAYALAAGLALLVGAVLIPRPRLAAIDPAEPASAPAAISTALASPAARTGALAIAAYVGAEGAIGAVLIGFLHQTAILGLSLAAAGRAVANLYWGGALVGRFVGSALLRRVRADALLGAAAVAAALLCAVVLAAGGALAAAAGLAIGVCNAIMFPTIFSLTLERSSAPPAAVSGLLCTAIAGGALISIVVGAVGDRFGLSAAFAVPLAVYAGIARFARGTQPSRAGAPA